MAAAQQRRLLHFFLDEIDRRLCRIRHVELRCRARQWLIRCIGHRTRPVLVRMLRVVLGGMRVRIARALGMRMTMARMVRARMRMALMMAMMRLRCRHNRGSRTAATATSNHGRR